MSPFLALALAFLPSETPTGDRAAKPELPRYAIKVAKANNVLKMPPVQMQLGRVLTTVNLAKAAVLAAS